MPPDSVSPRPNRPLSAVEEGVHVRVRLERGATVAGEIVRCDRFRTRVRCVVADGARYELVTELGRGGWRPIEARRANEGDERWAPVGRVSVVEVTDDTG